MKGKCILLVLLFATLLGCSTHYYTLDENNVTLYLKKPSSKTMVFACSLDGYAKHELKQQNGLWELTLPANKPFRYFYLVDGEMFLPPCPLKENDDFGTANCIFQPDL